MIAILGFALSALAMVAWYRRFRLPFAAFLTGGLALGAVYSFTASAANLAGLRYRAGLSNQLAQLTAEDSQVALARAVADLEARRLSLDIALIRALGGGFAAASPTGDKQ